MWNNPRTLNALAMALILFALSVFILAGLTVVARSNRFTVRTISVTGALKNVDTKRIESIVRKEFRGTYFTLNLEKARSTLVSAPWVKSVTVRRKWPRALEIQITEHEALARWNDDRLISVHGVVFEGGTNEALPTLRGPSGSEGDVFEKFSLAQNELVRVNKRLQAMTLSPSYSLSARLDGGVAVEFGHDQFEPRLRRLVDNATQIYAQTPVPIERFDLRYGKGIAVAYADSGSASSTQNQKNTGNTR